MRPRIEPDARIGREDYRYAAESKKANNSSLRSPDGGRAFIARLTV